MEEPWKTLQKKELKKHLSTVIFSSIVATFVLTLKQISPLLFRWLLNDFIRYNQLRLWWQIILTVCLIPIVTWWVEKHYKEWAIGEAYERSGVLSEIIFISLLNQPLTYFEKGRPIEIYNKYTKYSKQFFQTLIFDIPRLVSKVFVLVNLLLIIGSIVPLVAWLQLALFILFYFVKDMKIASLDNEVQTISFLLKQIVEDTFKYIGVIKVYDLENLRVKRLSDNLESQRHLLVTKELNDEKKSSISLILKGIFVGISFGVGMKAMSAGSILGGDLLLIMVYLPVLHTLAFDLMEDKSYTLNGFSQLFEFLAEPVRKKVDG